MRFQLTDEQMERVYAWKKEQDEKVYKKQIKGKDKNIAGMASMFGKAYYGAAGGELTYCFTPTGLGVSIVVRHGSTKEELDLETWKKC